MGAAERKYKVEILGGISGTFKKTQFRVQNWILQSILRDQDLVSVI
jgi:hypothetical protein